MSRSYKNKSESDKLDSQRTQKGYSNKHRKNGKSKGADVITKTGLDNSKGSNDPNDYFYSKELAEQAAQLSFQSILGLDAQNGYEVPTIARIDFNPCPGISYTLRSPARYEAWKSDPSAVTPKPECSSEKAGLNMMSVKTYTLLSTFSGRTSNYGPQDVGAMELAIASIAELSEHIRRAFGVALTYNPMNRVLPVELIRSMNIDPEFLSHIADCRMKFNVQMSRINQIPLLDNVGYIRKARHMYEKVFKDSDSGMAQYFYYAPYTVWIIQESLLSTGTMLFQEVVSGSYKTMDMLIDLLSNMITNLLESTTLNLIYADLLNMANKIKVPTWQFDYLAENYVVLPELDQIALLQFHNLNVVGEPATIGADLASGVVTPTGMHGVKFTRANHVYSDPDTNSLVYNPVFNGLYKSRPETLVDLFNDKPTIVDRIESLRMSCIPSGWYLSSDDLNIQAASTIYFGIFPTLADHYCVDIKIFGNKASETAWTINQYAFRTDVDQISRFAKVQSRVNMFQNGPMFEMYDHEDNYKTICMTGDLTYYTKIGWDYLDRVNKMMYVGLFDFRV